MKRRYSKQLAHTSASSSMLLRRHSHQRPGFVPLRLNPNTSLLDLSARNITSLEGIEVYRELQALDLTNNLIDNLEALNPLRACKSLQEISLAGTPLSWNVNYAMQVTSVLPNVRMVDGIFLGDSSYAQLSALQADIGRRVRSFLLQKCRIGMELVSKRANPGTWQVLKEQLTQLHSTLDMADSTQSLMDANWELKSSLPLSSIGVPMVLPENEMEIQNYLIDTIILQASQTQPALLEKLMHKIEVFDEEEEGVISKNAVVAKEVLKMYMLAQQEPQGNSNEGSVCKNHYTSADTAIDSNDRYGSKPSALHFLLDGDYVQVLRTVLAKECSFMLQKIDEAVNEPVNSGTQEPVLQQNLRIVQKQDDAPNFITFISSPSCRSEQGQLDTSPAHLYGNPLILSNLLAVFSNSLLKVVFDRIKHFRSKQSVEDCLGLMEGALSRIILESRKVGYAKIEETSAQLKQYEEAMRMMKMRRLFKAWQHIKKRKLQLLKKLLRKKKKADNFQKAVYMAKWRMNIRANTLKKMASEIILSRPTKQNLPVSKKGVDLVYRRIKEQGSYRAQLRMVKS